MSDKLLMLSPSPRTHCVDLDVGAPSCEELLVHVGAVATDCAGVMRVVLATLIIHLAEQSLDPTALVVNRREDVSDGNIVSARPDTHPLVFKKEGDDPSPFVTTAPCPPQDPPCSRGSKRKRCGPRPRRASPQRASLSACRSSRPSQRPL